MWYTSEENHNEVKEFNESIKQLNLTKRIPTNIMIYIEQIRSIGIELENTLHSLKIESHQRKLKELKAEVMKQKNKARTLQKNIMKSNQGTLKLHTDKIDEIISRVQSSESKGSSSISESAAHSVKGGAGIEIGENTMEEGTDNLQHLFYTLGLSAKINLSSKHPGKSVSISALYKAALERNIPSDDWALFIVQQLKSPAEWIPRSINRKRREKRSWFSKGIETIMEEDN